MKARITGLKQKSMMISVKGGDQLHIRRLYKDIDNLGAPVLMVHGIVEDGHIFYSRGRLGLANFLADSGYDVYVADLRGKGRSWPSVGSRSEFGYHQVVTEDIPVLIKSIVAKRGKTAQIWMAHGLGGLFLTAYLARFGQEICPVSRIVHFGTRRSIKVNNWRKRIYIDWLWKGVGARAVKVSGYLPARLMRLGTMDESARCYKDSLLWIDDSHWRDPNDNFSYSDALKVCQLPPSLYFAAAADRAFAHPDDVRRFINELGNHDGRYVVLSKDGGNLHDYGHVDMLLNPDANVDHFPFVREWLADTSISWPECHLENELECQLDYPQQLG